MTENEYAFIIAGLGNPGFRYRNTRHNVGFKIIDQICRRKSVRLKLNRRLRAKIACCGIGEKNVILAQPSTFMNRSGIAIELMLNHYRLGANKLFIIVDDVDLPVGRIRLREKGSDGGHKGLKSIIEHIDTIEFARLRIGIGKEESPSLSGYVLSKFSRKEGKIIAVVIHEAADAVEMMVNDNIRAAMNKYNALNFTEGK